MRGKTLGIVGNGHIGTQIGVLAEQLGNARESANLGELLRTADVVSLRVPHTPESANMIGTAQLAAMKLGGLLINASRGDVVEARRSRPS